MDKPACILCSRTADATPLLTLDYRDTTFRICPQHLPILIHDPQSLIGIVPGAETLEPSAHRD